MEISNITPLKVGTTMVRAKADGIAGEAELQVVPDKIILVDPYYQAIAAGQSHQYTATQYQVVRNSQHELALCSSTTPSAINWKIPTYGMSMFDIATVDNNDLVSVKSNASPGMLSYVIASNITTLKLKQG